MLLAKAGVRVRVLERLAVPGGRTSTISTPAGFKFDLGPTFFLYPRVLDEIFEICGRDLRQEVAQARRVLPGGAAAHWTRDSSGLRLWNPLSTSV